MIFSALVESEVDDRADRNVCQHYARQDDCLKQHIYFINACTNCEESDENAYNKQFNEYHTAVDDGQINLTPNDQAYRAAKEAMNGYDPSYGALYYYNPATATSSWIFSRKTTVTIGNHVFAV